MDDTLTLVGPKRFDELLFRVMGLAPTAAAAALDAQPESVAVALLEHLNPSLAREALKAMSESRRSTLLAKAPPEYQDQWERNITFPPNSVGALMMAPSGVVRSEMRVPAAIDEVRRLSSRIALTYLYAIDAVGRLVGVVVFRDLFLAAPDQCVADVMIRPPFFLRPEMTLIDAMKAVVSRHYPVYPVCDADQRIIGLVRGHVLFEKQAYLISAQAGSLVGVRSKERLSTPFWESFKLRHPWLQINLVMSLFATVVMGMFKGTIEKLVILAIFAPLVTAQARNSSAQTMAIVLRAISTGEWVEGSIWRVVWRETAMALFNGVLVGVVGGFLLWWHARGGPASPLILAGVMIGAMAVSCGVSAIFAVFVPHLLRRFGADPALAGGIILSTLSGTLASLVFFWFGSSWAL